MANKLSNFYLSQLCPFCQERIFMSNNRVMKKGAVAHLSCYLKNKVSELEFAEYNDVEKRIEFLDKLYKEVEDLK